MRSVASGTHTKSKASAATGSVPSRSTRSSKVVGTAVSKNARVLKSGRRDAKASVAVLPATSIASPAYNETIVLHELEMGRLLTEKCELRHARESFERALDLARVAESASARRHTMEALAGLLRLAGEALSLQETQRLESELDRWMAAHTDSVPSMVWYCKGAIARHFGKQAVARQCFHQYIKAVRADVSISESEREASEIRGWMMLAVSLQQRQHLGRSQWLASHLLAHHEAKKLRAVNGTLYLLQGHLSEMRAERNPESRAELLQEAYGWYRKAHASFLAERNWYLHLYAILGYARVERQQQNHPQACWHLDLIDQASSGPEFGALKREIEEQRRLIRESSVDVFVDTANGFVKVRELGVVSLRKQYVLLGILEELAAAHAKGDGERGLSKAEIIERVWKENYRPEAHDNKLYYNINRLRKLIEPDVKLPRYLLNWKEGYRLAPGLRVQVVKV